MSLPHIPVFKWLGLFLGLLLLSLSELIQSTLIKEALWTSHLIKTGRINSSHIEFFPLVRGPQLQRSLWTTTFLIRHNTQVEDTQYIAKRKAS